jgi:hypothetical protein
MENAIVIVLLEQSLKQLMELAFLVTLLAAHAQFIQADAQAV